MGCGCSGGMFQPQGVVRAERPTDPARAKNRMTSLVGGEPQRKWSGPLRPARQPKAE